MFQDSSTRVTQYPGGRIACTEIISEKATDSRPTTTRSTVHEAVRNLAGVAGAGLGRGAVFLAIAFGLVLWPAAVDAKEKETSNPGFVVEFAAPSRDVLQALQEVLEDETIHGTFMFDKDQNLTGASVVSSTPLFGQWDDDGKVFYKVKNDVIAPRHFLDSADQGTVAVRYVVMTVNPERTRLRIDAVFVEKSRRKVHPSDGTVESAEAQVIKDHLQSIQFAEQEAADAKRRREGIELAKQTLITQRESETTRLGAAQLSVQDLEHRVDAMRHQVEQRVKAPGANLLAAPFHSAAKVTALGAYTEVVIVIVTPRWYGVETPEGQRGWLPVDQLESLP